MRPTAATLLLGALACSGLTVPEEPPSVEGTILFWISIPTPPEVTPGVGIRLLREDPFCNDIVVDVAVTEETLVKRLPDGTLQSAGTADLEEGRVVRAWTVEAVTGCPWRGTGRVVEVIVG